MNQAFHGIEYRRKQRPQILRFVMGLMVLLGIQSCTSLNNLFYWADTYIAWEVDNYFDLTNDQETLVDQRLEQVLLAYKNQEIPKYIGFLQEVRVRTEQNLTHSDLEWFRKTLRQFNVNIAYLLANDATVILAGLQDRQIPYFEQKLAESNEKWQEERKERSEKSDEKKLEKRLEGIEEWVGDLTREQKQRIAVLYQPDASSQQLRFERRLKSQQRFVEILKKKTENQEFKSLLMDWYLNSDRFETEEYQEHSKKRDLKTTNLVLMIDQTATEKQRRFFHKKLDGYIEQLERILSN